MKVQKQKLPYRLLLQLAKTKNAFKMVTENAYHPMQNVPIIFAVNHSNCYDFPITATAVGRHVYVLVGKQRLGFLDRFFFSLNGVIYADRLNKNDTTAAKKAIISVLRRGHSICWYPEGTWNLSANLLVLPLKWGIIDVAKQAGAQIIPVGLHYNRESEVCRIMFGAPLAGSIFENKKDAIDRLRDEMATLQWDLMNALPAVKQEDIDRDKLKWDVMRAIEEYPPLDPEYERRCVFRPYKDVDIIPPTLTPQMKNAFLFDKRLSG